MLRKETVAQDLIALIQDLQKDMYFSDKPKSMAIRQLYTSFHRSRQLTDSVIQSANRMVGCLGKEFVSPAPKFWCWVAYNPTHVIYFTHKKMEISPVRWRCCFSVAEAFRLNSPLDRQKRGYHYEN